MKIGVGILTELSGDEHGDYWPSPLDPRLGVLLGRVHTNDM